MTLSRMLQGRSWMRPCEHELNGEFVTGLAAHYGTEAIEANPLVALRVNDVAVHYLLVLRVEEALGRAREGGGEDDPQKQAAMIDTVLRTRERLRKTMKELEEILARVGSGPGQGLADIMKPIMKRAEGVLEEVMLEEKERAEMEARGNA